MGKIKYLIILTLFFITMTESISFTNHSNSMDQKTTNSIYNLDDFEYSGPNGLDKYLPYGKISLGLMYFLFIK